MDIVRRVTGAAGAARWSQSQSGLRRIGILTGVLHIEQVHMPGDRDAVVAADQAGRLGR